MSQKSQKAKLDSRTVRRVLALIRPYTPLVALTLTFAAITVATTLLAPVLTGRAVDLIVGPGQVDFAGIAKLAVAIAATIAADLSRVARDRRRTTAAATTATPGTLRESGTTAVRTAVTINDVMIGLLSQTRAMHNALRVGEVGEGALVGEHGVDGSGGDGGHDAGELGIDLLGGHLVLDGGPVGRRDLLAVELLPVDVLEPGVVFDLVGGVVAEALGGLFLEQSADQIVRLSHRQTAEAPRET